MTKKATRNDVIARDLPIRLSRSCKRRLSLVLSVCLAASSTVANIAHGQSADTDFRAPVIEHEVEPGGEVGGVETFTANVVDNDELNAVKLFYRFAGTSEFTEVPMRQTASSSYFNASVDTSVSAATAVEYYIRAEDVSGNISLSGFAFEPLQRTLTPAVVAPEPIAPAVEPEPAATVNWLYVGLGILVAGGLAAGLSGGGGGGGGGGGMSTGTTCNPLCNVDVTVLPP